MPNKPMPPHARAARKLLDGLALRRAQVDERARQQRAEHEASVDRRGVEAAQRLRRRRRKEATR
jgi:hypothetical protein